MLLQGTEINLLLKGPDDGIGMAEGMTLPR